MIIKIPEIPRGVLVGFAFYFGYSDTKHCIDAVKRKNYKSAKVNRHLLTPMLVAGFIHPVYHMLS